MKEMKERGKNENEGKRETKEKKGNEGSEEKEKEEKGTEGRERKMFFFLPLAEICGNSCNIPNTALTKSQPPN